MFHSSARVLISLRDQGPSFTTTPPQTRKRKASEDLAGATVNKKPNKALKAAEGSPPKLNTPPLTTMDSEDEMSGLSSQDDFGEELDSDDGSLGEGSFGFYEKNIGRRPQAY